MLTFCILWYIVVTSSEHCHKSFMYIVAMQLCIATVHISWVILLTLIVLFTLCSGYVAKVRYPF